ncbi:serpin-ZX-like [Lolium rigidum]|uniref:serpin-ZX-like n=1 Tax=Lolium rigidum TaxID=89674 RepID=UPI001F5D95A5|nr:serpin-ZX-like [Lolium rigidum]
MAATDMNHSVARQTSFGLRLASAIFSASNADGADGNAAFSPLSLHVMLSFITAGAGGDTRDQLASILGFRGPGETDGLHALAEHVVQLTLADASGAGGPRVALANGVFVDASLQLKPLFKEIALAKYKSETHSVDFKTKPAEVAGQVNSWVDKVTSGLIKEILPAGSIDDYTKLVLSNALYFKGAWIERFDASKTKDEKFYLIGWNLLGWNSVKAPFMSSTNSQYISSCDNFKVLKLPYQPGGDRRQFSMYILLPEARDGIWSLARKLTSEPEFLEKHIPTGKVPVRYFKLPKFKISFGFEASELLKGLGLQLPFSMEADLSEMVDYSSLDRSMSVSSVFHKSFVEVNEEGTEAAAASASVVRMCKSLRAKPPTKVDFVADHPFIFVIREDTTGVVLFIGHVVNPVLVA